MKCTLNLYTHTYIYIFYLVTDEVKHTDIHKNKTYKLWKSQKPTLKVQCFLKSQEFFFYHNFSSNSASDLRIYYFK